MGVENRQFLRVSSAAEVRNFNLIGVSLTKPRQVVMIDGCFLKCLGRVLKNFIDAEKVIHIDALPMHKKYGDEFLCTDVPEVERTEVARQVADKILAQLKDEIRPPEFVA